MNNFSFYNPVRLHFGKGQINQLEAELPQYGDKILVVYGGGSIKRNGLYDEVMTVLEKLNMKVFELSGVEPNPRVETVRKGVEICKTEDVDFVLAVGGGSVIDCSKLIVAGAKVDEDPWNIVLKKTQVTDALPLGTILTIAATGSEMNSGSVITNEETLEKYGWGSPHVFPKFSILDPTYTFTLPRNQTIYGIVDMMSHVFEQYFHNATNTPITDEMCEGVLRTVIETAPKLVNDLENYELRETILLAGTIALNGFLALGSRGDWATHNIEHAVSAVYDIPHGGGLAIIFPNWMKYNIHVNPERFARLAIKAFGVSAEGKTAEEIALEGIERLREFWISIGAPSRLADYEIDDSQMDTLVEKAMINGPFGNFSLLQANDVRKILEMSL
ncbi:butanol dehydrogenase [Ureibacillus massiliensis 4400831 = CIP 108448 = CCUG 49529]|uniref:Butanol dehydrogenase n=1 Tax=Ureibacillus massiliensis 4400831 = CIP 108448 = CCUG 49529 TaxID=1211035 RepID=A0A0A3J419_9BACL|nr:iron-containing alcohol dehydrogenase [Ureibacillus massiliensis]KGR91696.1 butanol dehydrogenase [Ureibacillus massiliensis 4400831 = CIP 108448 = CCUG 49529]